VRKENELALAHAEMRMVRWMCRVPVRQIDRYGNAALRDRLGLKEDITLRQNSLRWYGHVSRKDEGDWVRRCFADVVEGAQRRGRPKKHEKKLLTVS